MAIFPKNPWNFLNEKWNLFLKGAKRLALSERSESKGLALSDPPAGGKSKGFTLIELLIAITIISMLIAASFSASYIRSLQRGRDTKRKGDVKRIQQAFEQYYGEKQLYGTCDEMRTAGYIVGDAFPTDPRGTAYTMSCSATIYCVCADLEQTGQNQGNAYNNNCKWTLSDPPDPDEKLDYFCVGSLQ